MDLLVLGANGLLGSNVVAAGMRRGWSVTGTYHTESPELATRTTQLDITDTERFRTLFDDVTPDAVVNCAAMTDVDGCESNPSQAENVNGRAPGELADATSDDTAFVQVSTDYVFDGQSDKRYVEDSDPNPIQAYGMSKLLGEQLVSQNHPSCLIPRLSFVYGRHAGTGKLEGFPAWVRNRLTQGDRVPAFTDQHITPSRVKQSAETILDLLDHHVSGRFHVAARTCTTPYRIARLVATKDGADESLIERGHMSEIERPAERPRHTCFDVGRVESVLSRPQPTVEEDLQAVF